MQVRDQKLNLLFLLHFVSYCQASGSCFSQSSLTLGSPCGGLSSAYTCEPGTYCNGIICVLSASFGTSCSQIGQPCPGDKFLGLMCLRSPALIGTGEDFLIYLLRCSIELPFRYMCPTSLQWRCVHSWSGVLLKCMFKQLMCWYSEHQFCMWPTSTQHLCEWGFLRRHWICSHPGGSLLDTTGHCVLAGVSTCSVYRCERRERESEKKK